MKTLKALTTERSEHQAQVQNLQTEIAQWEQQLGQPQIDASTARQLETSINNARSRIVSLGNRVDLVDRDIAWFDRKHQSAELMAGYRETMQSWALDKQDLQGKREVLSTRLENIRNQVEKMLTEARQAEQSAATAYAQAVAWSDTQAENAAAAEAQKAARGLAVAQENQRRQELIIGALKNELQKVNAHIEEAEREFAKAEKSAVSLATERLQEEWDDTVEKLIEIGAKLYRGKAYLGREQMAFRDLKISSELNSHQSWGQAEVIQRSAQFSPQQILNLESDCRVQVDKAA